MDAIALGCVGWGYRDVEIRIRQLLDQQLLGRRRRGHRGALVLGAIARTLRHPSPVNAVILGVGVAILANSRPYEGLLFCIPAAVWFVWALARKLRSQNADGSSLRTIIVSLIVVLTFTGFFMGYYNWRLTGHALMMPGWFLPIRL